MAGLGGVARPLPDSGIKTGAREGRPSSSDGGDFWQAQEQERENSPA